MGSRPRKGYDQEALEHLAKCLKKARPSAEQNQKFPSIKIKMEGLQKAVQSLPKKEREKIERFWGLTGGPNHSKKMSSRNEKDVAYTNMFNEAIKSMRKLYDVDYISMYDENLNELVELILRKVDKNAIQDIEGLEIIKYLISFFMYVLNGPKMPYEEDWMYIDEACYVESAFDEYSMIRDTGLILSEYPDNSVNLRLLISFYEMMDYQDMLTIKKSLAIRITEDCNTKDIQIAKTFTQVRQFKEKIFKYGVWEVTSSLIIGNTVDLEGFKKEVNKIRKDWSKIEKYKVNQKSLKTSREIRRIDVYNIGGLEFTDPYEVMFLYLERNLIAPES